MLTKILSQYTRLFNVFWDRKISPLIPLALAAINQKSSYGLLHFRLKIMFTITSLLPDNFLTIFLFSNSFSFMRKPIMLLQKELNCLFDWFQIIHTNIPTI